MCYEIQLPTDFIEKMKAILPEEEQQSFFDSYQKERYYGFRYNPLKCDAKEFEKACRDYCLEKIEWAKEGYYYHPEGQPGKRVYHEAGMYYIQEPSAMAVVELLDPRPGDVVLDLCAAPGGKSTQIAGRLQNEGLLVSNEIVPNRCKILSQNIERIGVANCVVTNESPEKLAKQFGHFFDKIVVDAPCSGEGMFRKEPEALRQWSNENVLVCAQRQQAILEDAAGMLKPGGVLVYSTCTFSPEENEDNINAFLEGHPEFSLVEWKRIWPHKEKGEGHFMAKLLKSGIDSVPKENNASIQPKTLRGDKKLVKAVQDFLETELGMNTSKMGGTVVAFGEQIYLLPEGFDVTRTKGLKIERPGLHLATDKKNRFEPAHALAMAMQQFGSDKIVALDAARAIQYLHGESVMTEQELKGWCVVAIGTCTMGIAKASQGVLKNHYPKGLRKDVIF